MLYTTREYDCGCKAAGPGDVPNYCPEHEKPMHAPSCATWQRPGKLYDPVMPSTGPCDCDLEK